MSQCTYRCVVLPDRSVCDSRRRGSVSLNAPTGAWCSLTGGGGSGGSVSVRSQCTYRCVVLPDSGGVSPPPSAIGLNAPTGAWCSLTGVRVRMHYLGGEVSMHLQVRGAP